MHLVKLAGQRLAGAARLLAIMGALFALGVGLGADESSSEEPKEIALGQSRIPVVTVCDAEQYDCSLRVLAGEDARIYWAWQDARNHYRLDITRSQMALYRVRGGHVEKLASASGAFLEARKPMPLTLRRRANALYVIARGQIALDCLDSTFSGGPVAGKNLEAAGFQPAEEVFFSDDFMRTEKEQELGDWTKVSGTWQFHSVKETNVHADFRLSVNPFSLGGKDPEGAVVTVGFPFWCDYTASVSVKSQGGVAGLVFGYQGEGDYFLLRMDLRAPYPRPSGVELLRITPQGPRVLASGTVRAASGDWYRLGVRTDGPRVQAILDGDVLFDLIQPGCIGGPVGLYAQGEAECFFDDVKVEPTGVCAFDRAYSLRRNGRPLGEGWRFIAAPGERIQGDTGPHHLVHEGTELARYVLGDPGWQGGVIQTRVQVEGPGGWAGVLFGYQDERNWRLARWRVADGSAAQGGGTAAAGARLQYIRCIDGKKQIAAESTAALENGAWHDLLVDCTNEGYTHIYLDGRLRLRVADPVPAQGRAGLYSFGATRARFADTAFRLARDVQVEQTISNEVFRNDPFMKLWSSSYGQWVPVKQVPNVYWNKGDFFNSYQIAMPITPGLVLAFATEGEDFGQGYRVSIEPVKGEKETCRVHLSRLEQIVKTAKIQDVSKAPKLTLHRSGDVVWAMLGSRELFSFHDPRPLPGRRVGIATPAKFDLANVEVRRENVADYPFEEAGCDWEQYGNWVVTNRFSCTPTWSHLSALADRACAMWNKYAFSGDLTVEFYAGMRQTNKALSYPRIGDMNVTICGDGRRLDSGYSYVVGAWDPGWTEKWTQLLRGTEVVEQTDRYLAPRVRESSGGRQIEVPWTAEGRPIHGAWYYIKIRRVGNRVECYFDNVKVLTYEDGKPLDGRFLAIWTQMNEVVFARASITYEHRYAPKRLLTRGTPPTPLPEPGGPKGPLPVLASSTHPGFVECFESPETVWKPTGPARDVVVERVAGGPAGSRGCLRVTNIAPGGDLGAAVPLPSDIDASRAVVEFDYRIPKDAKIHLYVTLNGQRHFVRLTGTEPDNAILPLLGEIPIRADGQWHRARFDLGYAVSRLYPGKRPLRIGEMLFGHFHEGYLRAGIGGNGPGVSYAIDNFIVATASATTPVLTWSPPQVPADAKSATQAANPETDKPTFLFSVDRDPLAEPQPTKPTTETKATLKDLGEGLWFAHVRWLQPDGAWSRTAHLPIHVVVQPLSLQAAELREDAPWGGDPIRFRVQPATGPHLDLSRLAVTVNGRKIDRPARIAEYDPVKRQLSLDLQRASLTLADQQKVKLEVQAATADGPVNKTALSVVVSASADTRPPDPPVVASPGLFEGFEEGTGSWRGAGALVTRDTSTAASGKASLRITNTSLAGSFSVTAIGKSFNVGRTPLLRFAYRVPEGVCINPAVITRETPVGIRFTDRHDSYPVTGFIRDAMRDGQWHTAEVNLQQALAGLRFRPDQFDAVQLVFGDRGYTAAPAGASYSLDDFQLIPTASGAAGITLSWSAADVTGIQAYRYKWSDKPDDIPDTVLPGSTTQQTFRGLPEGRLYFHLQAQDGAGNWSEPSHTPFLIDNTPPRLSAPSPAPGKIATSQWTIRLSDTGGSGFDPRSLKMTVNGKEYPLAEFVTTYAHTKRTLTWDWSTATGLFSDPIPDGQAVEMTLAPVKDFAGNAAEPTTFRYTVDRASDKEPPRAPAVDAQGRTLICYDTFTRDVGQWAPYGGGLPGVTLHLDPERGDTCARLSTSGSSYGYWIRMSAFDAVKAPFISFDYRCPQTVNLHLALHIKGRWYTIPLSGKNPTHPNLGPVKGFNPDGKWHTIAFNYLDILRAAKMGGESVPITHLALWHQGSGGGQFYDIDNFQIFGSGTPEFEVTWSAADPTGIHAFSYRIDADPEAGLAEQGGTETTERKAKITGLKPGMWFLRVRARDGAGNWSAPALVTWHVPG